MRLEFWVNLLPHSSHLHLLSAEVFLWYLFVPPSCSWVSPHSGTFPFIWPEDFLGDSISIVNFCFWISSSFSIPITSSETKTIDFKLPVKYTGNKLKHVYRSTQLKSPSKTVWQHLRKKVGDCKEERTGSVWTGRAWYEQSGDKFGRSQSPTEEKIWDASRFWGKGRAEQREIKEQARGRSRKEAMGASADVELWSSSV